MPCLVVAGFKKQSEKSESGAQAAPVRREAGHRDRERGADETAGGDDAGRVHGARADVDQSGRGEADQHWQRQSGTPMTFLCRLYTTVCF